MARRSRSGGGGALRLLAALLVLVLFAAGCGDDGEAASGTGDPPTDQTTAAPAPVAGGEATVVLSAEIRSLDPAENEIKPLLAKSLEPNDDFTVWTLTLNDGLVFSDGSAFDASAVKAHWERLKDPGSRSPALRLAAGITSLEVVDPLTLQATLASANAHFDRSVERVGGMNYVPSPAASPEALASEPVGAGPFILERWFRDDQMVLVRNPNWFQAPAPYLDRLTFRVISDEDQRLDTILTNGADAGLTSNDASVKRGTEGDLTWTGVEVAGSPVYSFNTQAEPFDDIRVRRAFIQGIDRAALVDAVFGPGAQPVDNYATEGTTWFSEDSALPAYDPDEAQALFDEVAAERGSPVSIVLQANQQSADQQRAQFVQAALNQFDNVEVTINVVDQATATQNVLQGNYQVASWGYPYQEPEPGVYAAAHSNGTSNFTRYSDGNVDAALDAARATRDPQKRAEAYQSVFAKLAEDLPWYPYRRYTAGFLARTELHGVELFGELVLRSDLLWKQA